MGEKKIKTGQIITMSKGDVYIVTGSVIYNDANVAHLVCLDDSSIQKIVLVSEENSKLVFSEIDMHNEENIEKIKSIAKLFVDDCMDFLNKVKENK